MTRPFSSRRSTSMGVTPIQCRWKTCSLSGLRRESAYCVAPSRPNHHSSSNFASISSILAFAVAEALGPAVAVLVELAEDVLDVRPGEVVHLVAEGVVPGPAPDQGHS